MQFGLTPLHVACNAAVAELLIENGAKIELTSKVIKKRFRVNFIIISIY